jgi:hypothetical protein
VSLESELRSTSDNLLAELNRLADLESAKRDAIPGTPEFVELSRKVEDLAAAILGYSKRQVDLAAATEVLADKAASSRPSTPIAAIDPARDPSFVLAEWRDAERRLAELEPGSPGADRLREQIDDLREEYGRSFDARR